MSGLKRHELAKPAVESIITKTSASYHPVFEAKYAW
jgi:hypothetical protein